MRVWTLCLVLLVGLAVGPAYPDPRPDVGRALYLEHCTICHGPRGRGNGPVADTLSPRPADLTHLQALSDQKLFDTIKYGEHGSGMVGWRVKLNDDRIRSLVHYLRTL